MHEFSLMNDLFSKIEQVAHDNNASRVTKVKVTLGALSHISCEHFKEHFDHYVQGTMAENAQLEVSKMEDENHPLAQEIVLESVDVE